MEAMQQMNGWLRAF
ncbi:hypothetical protein QWA68_016920 [Fusarium oxysporum]|nr:hypothetical protein QWA68_016920 [Fusarium oxysporum]